MTTLQPSNTQREAWRETYVISTDSSLPTENNENGILLTDTVPTTSNRAFSKSTSGSRVSAMSTVQPSNTQREPWRETYVLTTGSRLRTEDHESDLLTDTVPPSASNRAPLKSSGRSGLLPKRQTQVYPENSKKPVAVTNMSCKKDEMLNEHDEKNAEYLVEDCTENCVLEPRKQSLKSDPPAESSFCSESGDTVHFPTTGSSAVSTVQPSNTHRETWRETYVISTCPTLVAENRNPPEAEPSSIRASDKRSSSRTSGLFPKRQTRVYPGKSKKSVAAPRRETEWLMDENPPWASLDLGSADPFLLDSPAASSGPSRQPSQAIEIYQDASPTVSSQSPGSFPHLLKLSFIQVMLSKGFICNHFESCSQGTHFLCS